MPSLQVKNVPAETLAVLRRRAAQKHQSLQEYMLEKLIAEAQQPTWDEIWADIDAADDGTGRAITSAEAAELVRELRGPLPYEERPGAGSA